MEFLNKKQKIIFISIGIIMIIFIGCYFVKKQKNYDYDELEVTEKSYTEESSLTNEEETNNEKVIVHIAGEIEKGGVIEVEEGDRIADVIEKAGGVTEKADLSNVNLAYQVKDGQKIYIPNINEKEFDNTEYITDKAGEDIIIEENKYTEKVNINTATQTELETLNGIGPSTAAKIINYRKENGKYKNIEEIKSVPGIGEAKFKNIKENICV